MVETVLLLAKIKHYTIVKLQYGAGSQTKTTMMGENYKHNTLHNKNRLQSDPYLICNNFNNYFTTNINTNQSF